jgi:DNA-binding FadR family transcriptional regulator
MNSTTTLKPKPQERLYQKVAQRLADAVQGGEYIPGARLPAERKLAERFDVSRPTIREAIIALEIAGVVEVRGGSGVYVASSHSPEIVSASSDMGPFDILEARIVVEGEIAALAAKRITEEKLSELRKAIESMIKNNAQDKDYEEADKAFHLTLAEAAKNEALYSTCEHLWKLRDQSAISASLHEKAREAGNRPIIEEHTAILNAIEAKQPEQARNAMRSHLTQVIQHLLNATEAMAIETARETVANDRQRFGITT